jgi:hypothetical protein
VKRDGETARRQDGKTASRGGACVARLLKSTQDRASQDFLDPAMVEIRPEPSPFERAAILIALEQMLNVTRSVEAPKPSAWALAGRRESLLGSGVGGSTGWRRGSDRLAGW